MVEKIHHAITKWIVYPPKTHTHTNSYVKTPTLNVNMLGNRALKEVVDAKWGHQRRALIPQDLQEEEETLETGHPPLCLSALSTQSKAHARAQWKGSHLHSRESSLTSPTLLVPWSWTSSLQSGEKINFWGLLWWLSGKESICQCRRHWFDPWSGRIPHATEQLSWGTAIELEL